MTRPTELTTERLLLRPFRLSDIDHVLAYASDPEWATFYPRPYDRGICRIYGRTGGPDVMG